MTDDTTLPPLKVGLFRLALRISVIIAAVALIYQATDWATAFAESTGSQSLMIGTLVIILLLYAALIAVPFVPGIEIGISLLMLKGAPIAPMVYCATVLGLMLAFGMWRLLPYGWIKSTLADLRLSKASALFERLAHMPREERLAVLQERLPNWTRPIIGGGRYLLLAALLNIPGNAVIGGGGGIAFIGGFSRLYGPMLTFVVIAVAVLPVPLTVWIMGADALSKP
ncbi:MAG: hypothetical protein ABJ327_11345 [Litoreibacter sp.]